MTDKSAQIERNADKINRFDTVFIHPQNVEQKTILEIARELNLLQEKGAKSQLGPNELYGGTFTISNIGMVSNNNKILLLTL